MSLTWIIEVDWDNDAVFEDSLFARVVGLKVSRGRKTMITKGGAGSSGKFTRQAIGSCVLTVDNEDGKYDLLNTSSPIYPDAVRGRECKVRVTDNATATTYPVFRGRTADVVTLGTDFARQATIPVQDGWAQLENKISYDVVAGEDTGALIGRVLDKAGYIFSDGGGLTVWRFPTRIGVTSYFGPPGWTRGIGTGTDTVDYWWLKETKAGDAINDLVESEFGLFWFGADGVANFVGRHGLYAQASEATLTQDKFLRNMALRQTDAMRNTFYIKAYPKVLQLVAVLWKLGNKPLIKAGESVTYWPEWKYENRKVAARALVDPVSTTDYTANSASNGSGSDLTSSLTVRAVVQGETGEVVITNAGAVDLYVTFLQLRGVAIDTPNIANVQEADSDSVAQFGPQELSLDLKWQDSLLTAQDYARFLTGWLPDFPPFPMVQIEGRPEVQFAYDLFDRVTVQLPSLGVDMDFRIGGIEHEWVAPTGQGVRTTWYLEPILYQDNFWQFPVSMGIGTRFAF